nr:transcription factor PCF1-like [Ipomoea batatas]GMC64884.1 transcription factor PCF1-like [Ipomoea batatas]GMC67158.1 transcription factor PCF1-like [Ipomoea batatas]
MPIAVISLMPTLLTPGYPVTKKRGKGSGRHVCLPTLCITKNFQVMRELGHCTNSQTVEWLLHRIYHFLLTSSYMHGHRGVSQHNEPLRLVPHCRLTTLKFWWRCRR